MSNLTRTGRALQLEGITHSLNKVTIGFKCLATEKIRLAQEADSYGMTLSEYIESIVGGRHTPSYSPTIAQLSAKEHQLESQIEILSQKLAVYENDKLKQIFERNKGKFIEYADSNSKKQQKRIYSIEDAYNVILDTVKA